LINPILTYWQEREVKRRKDWDENLDQLFYMPTSSDISVRAFRKWFKTFGKGSIDWPVSDLEDQENKREFSDPPAQ